MKPNGDPRQINLPRILLNDHSGHPFQVQLSRALARRGYRIMHTYCDSFASPRGSLAKKSNDPISFESLAVRLDVDFERYALLGRWQQERELGRRLSQVVCEFAPDVVISSNTPLGTQSLLASTANHIGAGFVFWMQDALGIGYRNALRRRLRLLGDMAGVVFQVYERRLLRNSDAVIVITSDFLPYVPSEVRARNAATVIENWAPLDELPLVPKVNSWSRGRGLAHTLNFVYSGTLGLKHNPELLCRLAKAVDDRPDVRVVVISEGLGADWLAERQRAERLNNLVLLPFQPFDEMSSLLASSDILIALLEKDAGAFAVPSKVLTYLCAHRPVLLAVPSENLSAKVVRDSNAGITVDPDDDCGFIAAGLHLLNNPQDRQQYAENGRAYAERNFSIDRIADRFEEVIHQVLPAHHRTVNRAKTLKTEIL